MTTCQLNFALRDIRRSVIEHWFAKRPSLPAIATWAKHAESEGVCKSGVGEYVSAVVEDARGDWA